MRAETEHDVFLPMIGAPRNGNEGRYRNITRHVQYPKFAVAVSQESFESANVRLVEAVQVDRWPPGAVVPPERYCIAFDQLEETLQDGLLQCVTSSIAVGATHAIPLLLRRRITVVAVFGWQITEDLVRQ